MRCLLLALTGLLAGGQALAQTPATPPALADMALRGNLLQAVQKASQAGCQAACAATAGCSGYSLYVPGYAPEPPKTNCALLTGLLTEAPAPGVVSCRMPCSSSLSLPSGKRIDTDRVITARSPIIKPLIPKSPASVVPIQPGVIGTYAPPPAPPPRSGVAGVEVVEGPWATLPALSEARVSAQCSVGKVALSAGYEFQAEGDAAYGLEVRGAYPEGDHVLVMLRNANLLVGARGRALAICASPPSGLRIQSQPAQSFGGPVTAACSVDERLVGGGLINADSGLWMAGNGPWLTQDGVMTWQVYRPASGLNAPLAPPGQIFDGRALCAPEQHVDGWEYRVTPLNELGARAQIELSQSCSPGKVLLAAGFLQYGNNVLDIVANRLQLSPTGARARILNRNVLGGSPVRTALSVLCALPQ